VPQSITLADGRTLTYYSYGKPGGAPCIYVPGTPVSGLAGVSYDQHAADAGVELVCVDKPGYGRSTLDADGTLLSFAADVAALADHLGWDRFAVAGESGGGPYSLAIAHELPERVTLSVVLVGMGPGHEKWARKGMKARNWIMLFAAQRLPFLLKPLFSYYRRELNNPKSAERYEKAERKLLPPADLAMAEKWGDVDLLAVKDSFHLGIDGMVHEAKLFASPWGFDLAEVSVPVHLWHGTADVNVPVALAREVASRLPHATTHILEGVGHAAGHVDADNVMATIASAGVRL
jgi:pimeloyl-ACP methyl ester carboxylesterase